MVRYILEDDVMIDRVEDSMILSNAKLGVVVYGNKSTYDVAVLLNDAIDSEQIMHRLQRQYKAVEEEKLQTGVKYILKWLIEHRLVRMFEE